MPRWGTGKRESPENMYSEVLNPPDERVGMTPEIRGERHKNDKELMKEAKEAEKRGDIGTAQAIRRLIGD